MDLREKLRQFESDFEPERREASRKERTDIDLVVEGEVVSNAYGRFFRSVTDYPEDHHHGRIRLNLLADTNPEIFGLVGRDEALTGVDLRKAVFLDTETTGLAGGAGTVPFLVGLGYFSDDGFHIDQLFMRDLDEEHAVLHAVRERLKNCEALVSYNGKAYDLNILASRFTLSRMENPVRDLPHLDLLFTVRRLWRRRIIDCSLSNVEHNILDFRRLGDIPGYLIPSLYFEYLRSRDGRLLEPVFTHNRWDIITLVALAGLAGKIYQSPHEHLDHPLDILSLGKALERLFRLEEAAVCFRSALNSPMEPETREEVLRHLGFSLKRLGRWENAARVWEHMIETASHRIMPYEELAKYYEHRVGDFERATEVVLRALDRIRLMEELRSGLNFREDRRDLEYRLARLRRRVERMRENL
jgi:uncharacterized protein YprB with RNaseH-like and TPR domain